MGGGERAWVVGRVGREHEWTAHSEEWDKEEGNGIESTQRNGIQRKGTGPVDSTQRKGYRGRERGGQHSEEWDTEEGNGVDSTQRNGIQRKGVG